MTLFFGFSNQSNVFKIKYHVASFFGVVPVLDQNDDEKNENTIKCNFIYPVVWLAIYTSWYVFEIYTVLFVTDSHPTINEKLQVITLILEYVVHICFGNSIFLSAILKRGKWMMFLDNLELIGKKIATTVKNNILNSINTIGINFAFIISASYIIYYAALQDFQFITTVRFVIFIIAHYHEVLFALTISLFLNLIKGKYITLKRKLKETIQAERQGNISKTTFKNKIQEIHIFYTDLFDIVNEFNEIVKWSVFFFFVGICSHVLNATIFFLNSQMNTFYMSFIMAKILLPMMNVLVICMSCDGLEKSARKIPTTCYLLQRGILNEELRDEVLYFGEYSKNLLPGLSAAGFFNVNRTFIPTLFSSITTYLIVCIQFHMM